MPKELKNTTVFIVRTIAILLSGCVLAFAQVEPMPTYDLFTPDYQTYRVVKESYSFNAIRYMFQDRSRNLWMSSAHDFKRTNGYQFFSLPHMSGVPHNIDYIVDGSKWNDSTHYLVELTDDQLMRSLALYPDDPVQIHRLNTSRSPSGHLLFYDVIRNENAYEIWSDSTGNLSLAVVEPLGTVKHHVPIPQLEGTITHFCANSDGLWLVVDRHLMIYYTISQEGLLRTTESIYVPQEINMIHSDRQGRIWVTNADEILQVRNFPSGTQLTSIASLPGMQKVFEDENGNLILASTSFSNIITRAYLYLREGGRWISLERLIDQTPDTHIFAGENFEKEIFVGSQNSLLTVRFTQYPFARKVIDYQQSDQRNGYHIRGLYKSKSSFFALVKDRGLLVKKLDTQGEEVINFLHPVSRENLSFEAPSTIEIDTLGRLWFTSGGSLGSEESRFLLRYDPRTGHKDVVPMGSTITAIAGQGREVWAALRMSYNRHCITIFDVQQNHTVAKWDIPVDVGRINDLLVLNSNTLFLATDFGFFIYQLSQNKIEQIPLVPNPLIKTPIYSLFNYDGKYFLGGRDGLYVYNPQDGRVRHINKNSGLRNDIITAVFRERENKYWLGTLYGIAMINLDEDLVLNYSVRDGLPENEFNLYSYYGDETGFYLGYYNGVIRLDLRDSMKTYFTDFELDHAKLFFSGEDNPEIVFPSENHLDIPPNVNYLVLYPSAYASYFIDYFNFKLINSTLPDTLTFSATSGVILSHLDAGTYNLELRSFDRYGNPIPKTLEYTITINEHFYQATWFRIVLLLLANATLAYLVLLWIRSRNRKRRKAQKQAARLSELELQVLQAQLNPHFVFNTISAIQYYIQDHDDENADRYLTSFSRLMRMYLESSNSSFISLSSEIDLLTYYLELEIMVSDTKFLAHYKVDPQLDLDNMVIPTMTIQPFVENAIQHGLFNKEGIGNLYIRFALLPNNKLLCEVEDDGIGRAEAARINLQNTHKPESRALKIIGEKLEVLKVTRGMNIEIDIIDKYHDQSPRGTLVKICFPVMKRDEVLSLVKA